jgi:exodeoxyribonuclease V alpha subunit
VRDRILERLDRGLKKIFTELGIEVIKYETFDQGSYAMGTGTKPVGETTLRVGDRIIQLTNDYEREVFNGDVGFISKIDTEEQEVIVQYAEREVTYDYADLNEIALAWSVTIHKSQGSEYPVVILPMYTQHYMMLSRNLLYTGLTRAKKLAIIIGSQKAIGMAVRSVNQKPRYTQLRQRLMQVGLQQSCF